MSFLTMKTIHSRVLLNFGRAVLACTALTGSLYAFTPFQDDFSSTLDTNWNLNKTKAWMSDPSTSDGDLIMNTFSNAAGYQVLTISKRSDFNPFSGNGVSVAANGISLNNTAINGTNGSNSLNIFIGNSSPTANGADSSYTTFSAASGGAGWIGLVIQGYSEDNYSILLRESASGDGWATGIVTFENLNLSAMPTDLSWNFSFDTDNGKLLWSASVEGAVFTSNSSNTISGEYDTSLTEDMFSDYGSYFALSARNNGSSGNLSGETIVNLGEVGISSIPEPSQYTMLASAFILLLVLICKRSSSSHSS